MTFQHVFDGSEPLCCCGWLIEIINVKNLLRSLTTVVRAQNDTTKTANITYTIFDRTLIEPYKRRRFENRSDQPFCILLIKDVLSVNLHSASILLLLLLPPSIRRMSCDRSLSFFHSFCHSVNRITDERGNGRRPNLAGTGSKT